jgi:hypothetical protein
VVLHLCRLAVLQCDYCTAAGWCRADSGAPLRAGGAALLKADGAASLQDTGDALLQVNRCKLAAQHC